MLTGYIFFSLALAVAYAAIMAAYWYGWKSLPDWEIPPGFEPRTKVTVVIPARNEAKNIGPCLESVLAAAYPPQLLEILVVDDFSEDETAEIVLRMAERSQRSSLKFSAVDYFNSPRRHGDTEKCHLVRNTPCLRASVVKKIFGARVNQTGNIRLLRLADLPVPENMPAFGKKRAIQAAVAEARGELIVTTDADCLAPPGWLLLLVSAYEKQQPRAIVAPVMIRGTHHLLHYFQALDVAGTMGITGAGIRLGWQHMGNGANLAYPKSAFEEVGGFAGDAQLASGDDLFLLQKIARRWPGSTFFLKNADATVSTPAAPDWPSFFQQRLRWGAKNAALPETPVRLVLAVVFLFCCTVVLNMLSVCFFPALGWLLVLQTGVKAGADYLLLRGMCRFFGRRDWLRWFWPSFLIHTGYIAVLGAASLLWRKFEWKGRQVK